MIIVLLAVIMCHFSLTTADETLALKFVQMLYNHGERAPMKLYPNDPNPPSAFPLGLGALTMFGKKQHFGLGKFFSAKYKDFKTKNLFEINVVSSDFDFCFESAATNFASFYAPEGEWKFESVSWEPYSRYIIKSKDDFLETDLYCLKANDEIRNLVDSPEGQAVIAKHKIMFHQLTVNSGISITELTSASNLFDVLWIEKKYNLTVPKWVEPWWNELKEVAELSFKWKVNSPVFHRLQSGPLLQRIIKKIQEKINGDIADLKFQVYSARDINVAVVLDSLNLFNSKVPPYCATILFELYSGKANSHYLRLLYLNSTEPEKITQTPHILIINGCTEFCPIEYFLNYTQHLVLNDWNKECSKGKATNPRIIFAKNMLALAPLFLLLVLFIILVVLSYKEKKDNESRKKKYFCMSTQNYDVWKCA